MRRGPNRAMRVAGFAVMIVAVALVATPRVDPARGSAGADDAALAKALAERLLTRDHRWPAALYPGALPPGTPFDVPLPPGGRLLGSVVAPQPNDADFPAGGELRIVVDAPGLPSEAVAFYDTALTAAGWSIVGRRGGRSSGGGAASTLRWRADPPTASSARRASRGRWMSAPRRCSTAARMCG